MWTLLTSLLAHGQYTVNPENRHERILVICPMIGSGTADDPIRPLYTPKPSEGPKSGLISFSYELSDDKKTALVELVAADRSAFAAIRADKRADIKIFEKGKATKNEIEQEFRKYKPSFDAEKFAGAGRGAPATEPAKP